MQKQSITLTILLSLLLATLCTFILSKEERDLYVDLEIVSEKPTVVQVFYDLGKGFRAELSDRRKIPGQDVPQILRFILPKTGIKNIRIDFTKPATEIVLMKSSIACLHGGSPIFLELQKLRSLHDIQSITFADQQARITASGEDPQVILPLKKGSYNVAIPSALWITLFFMLYPIAWLLQFFIVKGFGLTQLCNFPGRPSVVIHRLCMVLAILAWISAVFYNRWEDPTNIWLQADVEKPLQKLYQKPFEYDEKTLIRNDGLKIKANVYKPGGKGPHPAILLLHGNYPVGQSYPLYRVLSQELAGKGYVVMTIDFAGYGQSEDPFASEKPVDTSLEAETRIAIDFLNQQPYVIPGRIGLIGHSMGADPALRVGTKTEGVTTIVLIGPPRRVQERFYSPADINFFWDWAHKIGKQQYGREEFPAWYSKKQWQNDILKRDMIFTLPYLSQLRHKPVLFIDGEREMKTDKQFLTQYVKTSSFPKRYVTLPKTDHDCNVLSRGNQIFYDPITMNHLVGTIDEWYQQTKDGGTSWKDYIRNLLRLLFSTNRFVEC